MYIIWKVDGGEDRHSTPRSCSGPTCRALWRSVNNPSTSKPFPCVCPCWYGFPFVCLYILKIYILNSNKNKHSVEESISKFNYTAVGRSEGEWKQEKESEKGAGLSVLADSDVCCIRSITESRGRVRSLSFKKGGGLDLWTAAIT